MVKQSIVVLVLGVILVFTVAPNVNAGMDNSLHVVLETEYIDFDVEPIIENGRVLVPIRAIAEKLEFTVEWIKDDNSITITNGDREIKLISEGKRALIDSKPVLLDVPPRIISGRTLVPLRFISESLGQNVLYEKWMDTPMIWITSFKLLDFEDVKIDENYRSESDETMPPIFYLKDSGKTAKDIRLGDTLEKVKAVYGLPFKDNIDSEKRGFLIYTTPFIPNSGSGFRMTFEFENGVLEAVVIS